LPMISMYGYVTIIFSEDIGIKAHFKENELQELSFVGYYKLEGQKDWAPVEIPMEEMFDKS